MHPCASASTAALLALAASALVSCGKASDQIPSSDSSTVAPSAPATSGLVVEDKNFSMPTQGTCKLGQRDGRAVPDPRCTPGAIDPAVTAANLRDTICQPDWREEAYPPVPVDGRMKAASARAYGLPADYDGEYDHLVSRMLGGSSEDPRNRWPQPGAKPNPKDRIEIALHEGVCKGMISLTSAQQALATNWPTAAENAGLVLIGDPNAPVEQSKACLRDNPSRCTTLHKAYDD